MYTLTKSEMNLFEGLLPDYVIAGVQEKGYFTLGAIGENGEEHRLLGMAQFHSNITDDGEYYVELVYVYVMEAYRRQGIGTKLLDRVRTILRKSDVQVLTLLVPSDDKGDFNTELPPADIEAFLTELGFMEMNADFGKWETILKEVYPKLSDKDVKRYLKMIKNS
jgi:GNAT superfamily N-acetyltransferase